ncbi:hypothetical protein Tco_0759336 [Tanacetum coccineum]
MEISKADQIALDDALVAPANRLKIGKCNLRLSSDVTSKEATLQVVYDVLKLTPFYKAFQVSADVPEIYMQEFWASAYIHNRSVRFKMNNKKHILNLDQFRDILQICPKIGNKKFEEPPLEKEILAFLASLGHSGEIRKITDVNVNKLHQPWRSFAAIINKLSLVVNIQRHLRLSKLKSYGNVQLTKGLIHAYLLWRTSLPIENKNTKKGNATNKVNWHYARDDPMFTTKSIMLLLQERFLQRQKQKAKELETISEAILTEAEQLKIITKRSRTETHSSHASGSGADEGTGVSPGVPDAPDYDSADISLNSNDNRSK